jgi:hypothetical protein
MAKLTNPELEPRNQEEAEAIAELRGGNLVNPEAVADPAALLTGPQAPTLASGNEKDPADQPAPKGKKAAGKRYRVLHTQVGPFSLNDEVGDLGAGVDVQRLLDLGAIEEIK